MADGNLPENRALADLFPSEFSWESTESTWEQIRANLPIYEERFLWIQRLEEASAIACKRPGRSRVVDRAQLMALTKPLGLNEADATKLVETSFILAGWQLAPAHLDQLAIHYADTHKHLKALHKAARSVREAIDALPNDVLDILNGELPRHNVRPLNELERQAINLDIVLNQLQPRLPQRSRGRPRASIRRLTVAFLTDALNVVTNTRIQTPSVSNGDKLGLKGPSGEYLRAFFKLVDPQTSEDVLAQSVIAHQKSMSANGE
jgi:hypothetical protein